jgi:hypothetical protein
MQTNISENEKIEWCQKRAFERIVEMSNQIKRFSEGYSGRYDLHCEIEKIAKESRLIILEPNKFSGTKKHNMQFDAAREKLGIIFVDSENDPYVMCGGGNPRPLVAIFPLGSRIVKQRCWKRRRKKNENIGRTTKIQLPTGQVIRYIESKIPEYAEYICGHFLL